MPAPEGGPDAPTATEVGQLIRLRAMLERAVAAARLNYTLDTGATTVLLDAVNERATHSASARTASMWPNGLPAAGQK